MAILTKLCLGLSYVGLDIGTSFIKIVVLKRSYQNISLQFAGMYPLIDDEGKEADIEYILKEAFQEEELKNRKVVVNLFSTTPFISSVQLPKMPMNELKEAIKWEASKTIPFHEEGAIWDYRLSDGENDKYLITLVAAEEKKVLSQADFLKKAGIRVNAIDVSPLACMRGIKEEMKAADAFIDIGHSKMEVNIARAGELAFTRILKIGGGNITRKIMQKTGMSYGQAEDAKKEVGLTGDQEEIRSVIQQEVDRMILEVRRSLDYFRGNYRYETINQIIISGGTAQMNGLSSYLNEYFELPVVVSDPFKNVEVEEHFQLEKPCFLPSVGMALREM